MNGVWHHALVTLTFLSTIVWSAWHRVVAACDLVGLMIVMPGSIGSVF